MTCVSLCPSIDLTDVRFLPKSPKTSPRKSPGVMTSNDMTGSNRISFPFCIASLNAIDAATLKAISEESTSW